MRTVKPVRLGVLHRVLELGRRPHLIITVFAGAVLGGAKEAIGEVAMWKLVEKNLGTGAILDEGYSKPAGEVVVHGTFRAPSGSSPSVSFAGLEVSRGEKKLIDKRLAILGRREWRSGVPSEPEPLSKLKLDWTHAFGGEAHPTNPTGLGMKPKDQNAPWLLPQIEDPKRLVRGPADRPEPAGFGPLDLGSIERRELAGDYGGDYVETRFPGPAADMDARFFHTVREDQRIEGFFQGGERLALINMNESEPRLEGIVHPLKGRAFIQRGDKTPLVEVPLRIDTLIVFPSDGVVVAVHRGVVVVDEDDASDVTTLVVAAEDPSLPRSVEHYREVIVKRTDRENNGALWALADEDLMPQKEAGWGSARLPMDDMQDMTKVESILVKRQAAARVHKRAEMRAQIARDGLDPDIYLPEAPPEEEPPSTDDIPAMLEFIARCAARLKDEESKAQTQKAELEANAREETKRQGGDWDAAMEEARKNALGPPKPQARQFVENMRALAELSKNAGGTIPAAEAAMIDDPNFIRVAEEQDARILDGYRASVHYRDRALRLDTDASALVRQRFIDARIAGQRPDDIDGTGADLSKLDLSGMNLSGALLESADLTDTVFDGSNLENAVLAGATLVRTRFVNANLAGANLGAIKFEDVDLSSAKLTKATFTKASVDRATFANADLREALVFDAVFGAIDCSGANLSKIMFCKLDLRGAKLAGALLEKTVFVECDLRGVDFTEAKLDGAILAKTQLDGATMARCSLKQSAWPSEVTATKVNLSGAHIERSCFRGVKFQGASFDGATLAQCDLGFADLTEASLVATNAEKSLFIRANLTRADARGASFMDAILTNAELRGTNFSKANMFRAMLSRARGDDATRFTGANVELVLHHPHYEPPKEVDRG